MRSERTPRRSYEDINYTLRPAKNVERKMLCEAFLRLAALDRLDTYRYVGFGSTYFSDFILLHKYLGLTDMVSIEVDVDNEARFNFNCPFNCIKMHFGRSTDILPTLDWDVKTILWLDYDYALDSSVLADIAFSVGSAPPGSVIVVTVDARPAPLQKDDPNPRRLESLVNAVGPDRVPHYLRERDLTDWGTAVAYCQIIDNEIHESLRVRNGSLKHPADLLKYTQLFNFHYADGAKMLTVGGMIFEERQTDLVKRCGFEGLPFISSDEKPYTIETPNLTYREMRHLDKQLPEDIDHPLSAHGVPDDDVARYALIYRYFPTFAEAEV